MRARAAKPESQSPDKIFYPAAALLAAAILLGGSGAAAPLQNLAIQLLALGVIATTVWGQRPMPLSGMERASCILLALIIATPLLQLAPLPSGIAAQVPGHDSLANIRAAGGLKPVPQPLSIDPGSTWLAAAYLLPPAAIFLATLRMDDAQLRRLLQFIVVGALISLVLGAIQFASGGEVFRLYAGSHRNFATGLFINRNHQASLLLVGMILSSALLSVRGGAETRLSLWMAVVVAFSAGTLATTSRMGLLLLPIAVAASASFLPFRALRRTRLLLASAAGILIAAVALAGSSTGRAVLERAGGFSDIRFSYWPEVLYVAEQYLPWGSGLGTFAVAYSLHEDLNQVDPTYLNHAHNEYLQLLVEAGYWGIGLAAAFIACVSWMAIRTRRDALKRAASLSILILLLHSLVDYPLRMISLLTIFGFLCAILVRSSNGGRYQSSSSS